MRCVSAVIRLSAPIILALACGHPSVALAANNNIATCTDFTVNNSTLNQDVTQGSTAAMLGTLRTASGNTCGSAIAPTPSADPPLLPTLGFQIAVVPNSSPPLYGPCSTGGGFKGNSDNGTYADPTWFTEQQNSLPAPNPDVVDNNGQVLRHLITSGITVGTVYGFRAHHDAEDFGKNPDQTTYQKSSSPCIDVRITDAGGNTPCGSYVGALPIVDQANGDGTPGPGTSGPWTFRITIWACNEPIVLQSAQGGTSGWTTMDGDPITDPPANSCLTVKASGASSTVVKNCLWATQVGKKLVGGLTLQANQFATITISEHATSAIPSSAPDGQARCLNGPWSAMYTDATHPNSTKSPYTDRAAVVVANPDLDGTGSTPGAIGCN